MAGLLHDAFVQRAVGALPADWPTPPGQAARLGGRWLDEALERCDDELFGRRFALHCPIPGATAADYQHRILPGAGGVPTLLAGIRFKGGDRDLPFIDLLAWDAQPASARDWGAVRARLVDAFGVFSPRWIRLRHPGQARPRLPGDLEVDQWLLAARLHRLSRQPRPWGELSLHTEIARDIDFYDAFAAAFARWQEGAGPVGREVFAPTRAELQRCLADGTIVVARHNGAWAGLAASSPMREQHLDGYCVAEIFLDAPLRGHRKAPVLLRRLVDALPDRGRDVLHSTVHRLNIPSLKAARRLGQRVVETWWFWEVDDRPPIR